MFPRSRVYIFLAVCGLHLSIAALICLFYPYASDLNIEKSGAHKPKSERKNPSKYMIEIKEHKLNRLLSILQDKEKEYGHLLDDLGVISFADFPNYNHNSQLQKYQDQVEKFLRVESGRVLVKQEYVNYLMNKSEHFLTSVSRANLTRQKILNVSLFSH